MPFAYATVLNTLRKIGSVDAHLRMGKMKAGPIVSDNGNFVIDAPFPEADMKEPQAVSKPIKSIVASADCSSS